VIRKKTLPPSDKMGVHIYCQVKRTACPARALMHAEGMRADQAKTCLRSSGSPTSYGGVFPAHMKKTMEALGWEQRYERTVDIRFFGEVDTVDRAVLILSHNHVAVGVNGYLYDTFDSRWEVVESYWVKQGVA